MCQGYSHNFIGLRKKACIIIIKWHLIAIAFSDCVRDRDAEWFSLIHGLSTLIS